MSCRRPDQIGEVTVAEDNSLAASSNAGTSFAIRSSVSRRCGPAMLNRAHHVRRHECRIGAAIADMPGANDCTIAL